MLLIPSPVISSSWHQTCKHINSPIWKLYIYILHSLNWMCCQLWRRNALKLLNYSYIKTFLLFFITHLLTFEHCLREVPCVEVFILGIKLQMQTLLTLGYITISWNDIKRINATTFAVYFRPMFSTGELTSSVSRHLGRDSSPMGCFYYLCQSHFSTEYDLAFSLSISSVLLFP